MRDTVTVCYTTKKNSGSREIMMDNEFRKKLIKLVLPITFQNFLFALIPVADAMMLVRLEQNAMSAVSLATQVSFVLNLFTFAITMGASMLVAQYWGKGDKDAVEQVWGFAQAILIPIGLMFFIAGTFFPVQVMKIFSNVPEIIDYGADYLRVVSFYYIILGVLQTIEVIMKNVGLVKQVTFVSCFMVLVNIFLNAVFIYGLFGAPELGVKGAAIATLVSCIGSIIITFIVQWKARIVRFRPKYLFKINKMISRDFIKYTGPVLGNQIGWGLGFATLTIIMGHLGEDAIAANSIVAVVKDLISCFCFALGSGGAIIVGNELGANNLEKAKVYGGKIAKLAIYSGLVSGVIILASTPLVISVVNISDKAEFYLTWMMVMCVYYMVGRSVNSTVIAGIFCSGGDTRFGFICDTITMWVVIIPLGAFTAFVLKAPVLLVFFVLNLDELVKLPAVYIHYKKYNWLRNITIDKAELENQGN